MNQNPMSLLWLGAGNIAQHAQPLLSSLGLSCTYVSRSVEPLDFPHSKVLRADVSEPGEALKLAQLCPDFCVFSFSPKGRRQEDYEQAYLKSVSNVLSGFSHIQHAPRLVIFISSTSVYPQNKGEFVDEQSETHNKTVSSSTMLACESLLGQQNFATCALRFSGIYGPGRYRLLSQVSSNKMARKRWTNRIHVQDCAAVIAFLLQRALSNTTIPKVLLASDNKPVISSELNTWLADKLGLKLALANEELASEFNADTGKRCDNSLLKSLGYSFRVPTYRSGFPAIIEAFKARKIEKI